MLSSCKINTKLLPATTKQNVINKLLWITATSRNVIIIIICGIISYCVYDLKTEKSPFNIIGHIPSGLPQFQVPSFYISANETANGTNSTNVEESFVDIIYEMGTGLIVVPLISLMESISICKAFGKVCKYFAIF